MRYEVAVVGLGGMGAATLSHLARRGVRAVGIDRFAQGHDQGASFGESRIIRKAYFENPAYVPLLERAFALWGELQAESQLKLLDMIGILMVGAPERAGIAGALRTARQYDLGIDVYDAEQIARRFPGTKPRPEEIGLLEHDAGIVFPEAGVAAHLQVAQAHGAHAIFDNGVESWETIEGTHRLTLADGTHVEAARVAFCPGMWAAPVLPDLELPLRVQRNVQIWFEPSTTQYDLGIFPTFFVERLELPAALYGFPTMHGTLKAALHGYGDLVDPDKPDRRIRDNDVTIVRDALEEWMPGAAASYARGRVCAYDLTPDGNFIIDRHPRDPSIAIACGFSGHGYKFCPVVGEILTDLLLEGGTSFDIEFLSLDRFAVTPQA